MSTHNDTESKDSVENDQNLFWNSSIDELLAKWCDQAKCFEWMHAKCFDTNYKLARKFVVFISLLTALSGLSNVIAGGYSIDGFQISWVFGGITILISTLTMLQDKLGYQQKADLHKRMSNQWGVIRGKIEEVVILPPNARKDCRTFIKMIKSDINQISLEGNSLIPDNVRTECLEKFKNIKDFDVPDVCGHVEHTKVYIDTNKTSLTTPLISN